MIANPLGIKPEESDMRYVRDGQYVLGWGTGDGMVRVYCYEGTPQTFSSPEMARHNTGLVSPTLHPLDRRKPLNVYRMAFEKV